MKVVYKIVLFFLKFNDIYFGWVFLQKWVNGFYRWIIFAKNSIIYVWQGFKYASEIWEQSVHLCHLDVWQTNFRL